MTLPFLNHVHMYALIILACDKGCDFDYLPRQHIYNKISDIVWCGCTVGWETWSGKFNWELLRLSMSPLIREIPSSAPECLHKHVSRSCTNSQTQGPLRAVKVEKSRLKMIIRQPYSDTSYLKIKDGASTSTEQNTMRLILCWLTTQQRKACEWEEMHSFQRKCCTSLTCTDSVRYVPRKQQNHEKER